jgi:hypothetical protein
MVLVQSMWEHEDIFGIVGILLAFNVVFFHYLSQGV